MNLADVLSGRAKLEGIRWMLRGGSPRRALRRELSALLPTPDMLGPCRFRRVRFKPGRYLTAYYDALVHMGGTGGYRVRPIAVTWTVDGKANRRQGRMDITEVQAEALRRGVAAPFRQLTAELPEWSMQVQVSPLDTRFPQLVRLLDPRHVRDMLAAAYAAGDEAPDQVPASGYAVASLRYRPGERHVLRYDSLDAAKGGTVFAKLYAREDGAPAFDVAVRVADWLAEHGSGVTSVRPLAYVAEDAVVLYPRVFGAPLSEHLRRPSQRVAQCLEHTGKALRALHHLPPAVARPLEVRDFAAEVEKTARGRSHIHMLLPSAGAAIDALLDRAREVHERLPQEPPTFTHGDFKSDHVWVTPGGPALIDFDSCRLADPAFDIGRFLADLQLWHIAYDQPGLEQAQERFLAGYAPGTLEERLVRARLYEVVQLVKITRRVPLFDHDWAPRTRQLIRRAQVVMNELTLGSPCFLRGWHKRRPPSRLRQRAPRVNNRVA